MSTHQDTMTVMMIMSAPRCRRRGSGRPRRGRALGPRAAVTAPRPRTLRTRGRWGSRAPTGEARRGSSSSTRVAVTGGAVSEAAAAGKGGEERERERGRWEGEGWGADGRRAERAAGFSAKSTAGAFLQNRQRTRIFSSSRWNFQNSRGFSDKKQARLL